jgi:hypothetical protein
MIFDGGITEGIERMRKGPEQAFCHEYESTVTALGRLIVRPKPKLAGTAAEFMRFLVPQKGSSALVDWDLDYRREFRRVRDLPVIHRLWVHRTGYSLGYTKRSRHDPAQLFFISVEGKVMSLVEMESSMTDVVEGKTGWHVGWKNGSLSTFALSGRRLWEWHSLDFGVTYHAVPVRVTLARTRIIVGWNGMLSGLSFDGTEVWRTELPERAEARYPIEVPLPARGQMRDQAGRSWDYVLTKSQIQSKSVTCVRR